MKLVTGREFRFFFYFDDPSSPEHEYGAIVKTVFEIDTPDISSNPANAIYYPFRGLAPAGYGSFGFGPVSSALATFIPTLLFHYIGVSIFPHATFPGPTSPDAGSRIRWRWTVGNPLPNPTFDTDVTWIDTGFVNLSALSPISQGSGFYNGVVVEIDAYNASANAPTFAGRPTSVKAPKTSFIFPPVDSAGFLRRIIDDVQQDWDGWPFLNLFFSTSGGAPAATITAGTWRFIHLFSEMLR